MLPQRACRPTPLGRRHGLACAAAKGAAPGGKGPAAPKSAGPKPPRSPRPLAPKGKGKPPPGRGRQPAAPPHSELGCPHFAACSGCTLENGLQRPPLAERAAAFFAQRGVEDFEVGCAGVQAWRCRARLAVRATPAGTVLGLFREGSHEVVDIPGCVVHHPRVAQAARLLQQLLRACRVTPYADGAAGGGGQLRYVQLTALPSAGQRRAEEDPNALVGCAALGWAGLGWAGLAGCLVGCAGLAWLTTRWARLRLGRAAVLRPAGAD
jgi:hypothetical protein